MMAIISPVSTFFFVALEVFAFSAHFSTFIFKSIMLNICCFGELILVYSLLESEDKRSQNIKDKFPPVRWDESKKDIERNYPYVLGVVVAGLALGAFCYVLNYTELMCSKPKDQELEVEKEADSPEKVQIRGDSEVDFQATNTKAAKGTAVELDEIVVEDKSPEPDIE